MYYLLVFIFGTIIGSFLNVCIYRIPLSKSIVLPRSYCPDCKHTINWRDNIPLLSFLILRARCRYCGSRISKRYFIVELLTGLVGVVLFHYFNFSVNFFVYWLLNCILIIVSFIDLKYREIPDVLSIPGILLGLLLFVVFKFDGTYARSALDSVLGILAGGVSMFLLGFIGEIVFKKEALGGGDVKLMAMIGAFLGWKAALLTFFIAPVFGSVVGIITKIRFKEDIIPYGPYISLASLVCLLYGERILSYLFIY